MRKDSDLILVKVLRKFPYHERAYAPDEIIQMTLAEANTFQSVGFVKIGSICIDQRVVNNKITQRSTA